MSVSLDQEYFDFCFKVLNYSIELTRSTGYASTRMTDVLQKLVDLSFQIEGVGKKEFYETLNEKFKNRRLMTSQMGQSEYLDELLQLFVDEWRKK
ncbi:hypothetical protein AC482_07260 [miscellaneous Crenarchaeota group-15 archaeon DG-45]|jgi:hypothetical protein|uniref:Uncharacterized protein n=1 Tax=miscellaneous Crenarchaeota group-15 archaeon DG-45 TaxID=1685127 RepID=A0A0M0BL99_9ARCH|nr:MAG: hypothetical protein AC482_07260 [miscellaneous Crenarchaeota group-15 archaeon DG-45]